MGRKWRVVCTLAVLLHVVAPEVKAGLADELLQVVQTSVQEMKGQFPGWSLAAWWSMGLVIAVGVLGAIAAVLQYARQSADGGGKAAVEQGAATRSKRRKRDTMQWMGVGIGAAITVLTLIVNTVFPADYREYRRAIRQGRKVITELEAKVVRFRTHPDVLAYAGLESRIGNLRRDEQKELARLHEAVSSSYENSFKELLGQLAKIEEGLLARVPLEGTVFAAAGLTVEAFGESNDPWQAEENAYWSAIEGMVQQLIAGKIAPSLTDRERQGLRNYVDRYGRKSATREAASKGRIRVRVQVSLASAYVNRALIAASLRPYQLKGQPATIEEEVDRIRKALRSRRPDLEVDGFLEKSFVLPATGGDLRLEAADPKDGSFEFTFAAGPGAGGQTDVRLSAMKIIEDASGGSTRWSFHFLSGGKVIFSLPEQRWSDSRRPTLCWWEAGAGLRGRAEASGGRIPLTIVGLKPKVK